MDDREYKKTVDELTLVSARRVRCLREGTWGEQLSEELEVPFLPSDFKKKNGYKRSVELSKEYDLYRQDYCGCIFSKAERKNGNSNRKETWIVAFEPLYLNRYNLRENGKGIS